MDAMTRTAALGRRRPMDTLKKYLEECEGKRRRMRARPSDAVLKEIRRLVERSSRESDDEAGRGHPVD